jgi:hypothetical protein
VSTMIAGTEKLNEIDADIRRAWQEYHQYLHDLTGQDYADAEPEAWELLQDELHDIEHRRAILSGGVPDAVRE